MYTEEENSRARSLQIERRIEFDNRWCEQVDLQRISLERRRRRRRMQGVLTERRGHRSGDVRRGDERVSVKSSTAQRTAQFTFGETR